MRSGPWKLHFAHEYVRPEPPGHGGQPGKMIKPRTELALFNLENDPSESNDLAARHPEIVARLQTLAAKAREDLGDSATKQKGRGAREPGRIDSAMPR